MSYPTSEYSEIRLLCHDPADVAGRLHIGKLIFASQLSGYNDQQAQYPNNAIVPNPDTIRRCTPDEASRYVHHIATTAREKTDIICYIGAQAYRYLEGAVATIDKDRWFGHTITPPHQLTTTRNSTITAGPDKEGLHLDSGSEYSHRLGVCTEGYRQLLTVTRPARRILGEQTPLSTSNVRRLLTESPALLGELACLIVPLAVNEAYDAWTSEVLHDGSTWLPNESGGANSPASIVFARL